VSAARHSALALSLGLLAAYAAWLFAHPVSLGSDDAFYFARGVQRFSVLELAPHFPGYPAFVLAAQALDAVLDNAARSLFGVAALACLAIPPAIYLFVRGAGGGRGFAWAAAACALLQPLLPALAVSLLSDSLGLALVLWHLVALQRGRPATAGGLLALALAARPSYVVMAAAAALCLALRERAGLRRWCAGFAAVSAVFALYVLSRDASGYLTEGWRFASGHFAIWGRGSTDAPGWGAALASAWGGALPAAAAALALLFGARSLDLRPVATAAALALFTAHAVWMLLAQNPDQPRHAAPLVFAGIALAGAGLAHARPTRAAAALAALAVAVPLALFAAALRLPLETSPLERASQALAEHPGALVITQRGVELLRSRHPELRILDAHYEASTRFTTRTAAAPDVLRLSAASLPPPWQAIGAFAGRFPAEAGLLLYRLAPLRAARLAP